MTDSHALLVVKPARVLEGEALLKAAGLSCAVIPLPRTLSSECGVCLRVGVRDRAKAMDVLSTAGIEVPAVHEITTAKRQRTQTSKERGQ
jgi:hypothetical protein